MRADDPRSPTLSSQESPGIAVDDMIFGLARVADTTVVDGPVAGFDVGAFPVREKLCCQPDFVGWYRRIVKR